MKCYGFVVKERSGLEAYEQHRDPEKEFFFTGTEIIEERSSDNPDVERKTCLTPQGTPLIDVYVVRENGEIKETHGYVNVEESQFYQPEQRQARKMPGIIGDDIEEALVQELYTTYGSLEYQERTNYNTQKPEDWMIEKRGQEIEVDHNQVGDHRIHFYDSGNINVRGLGHEIGSYVKDHSPVEMVIEQELEETPRDKRQLAWENLFSKTFRK